ncbi:MAG: Rieske 2Fe-2S domain-containing protein [Prochloraceae cyanobacterium]
MSATNFQKDMELIVQSAQQQEEQTFAWTKQWYPLAVLEFLDPARPHSIQLLGKDLVIWRDKRGLWNCFADVCPHRAVPLSEGRIESDGTLLCAYHAWRFNSEGKCVSIPQSKNKDIEFKNCSNPKSCATVYPTLERLGLLWVWGEPGERGLLESKLRSPRIISELEENSDKVVKLCWNIRDLPYGWDYFMENVSDPAHVPVSHHGIMGSRYEDAKYYDLIRERELSTQEGFSFGITPTSNEIETTIHDFQPPCLMKITTTYSDDRKFILALYAVPTRPGWCRHIGCQIFVKNDSGKKPPGLGFFALPMPIWFVHVLASLFLHQDGVFLHYQEKFIAKQKKRYLEAVYTPNPQDKMVITFRQWLEKRAGGEIAWDETCDRSLPPVERDKEKLFDVWNTHTKHCHICQNALKNINRFSLISYISAIICLSFGIIIDSRYVAIKTVSLSSDSEIFGSILNIMPPSEFWIAITGTILFALIGYLSNKLSRLFFSYEFKHYNND